MKKINLLIAAGFLALSGTVANAVTVTPEPVPTVDFGYQGSEGGSIDGAAGEMGDGTAWSTGSIVIDTVVITDANSGNGEYTVEGGTLTYDTNANEIIITGQVFDSSSTAVTDVGATLFSGGFTGWDYTGSSLYSAFAAEGSGAMSNDILAVMGEEFGTYAFVGFTIENSNGVVLSTDFLTASLEPRTPEVPIPPAVWLFGSGLLGLVGVSRRKPV